MFASNTESADQGTNHPDGLTSAHIDQLLAEAEVHWASAAHPTAAFLDGTAELRRERRTQRRAFGAVVRALPTRPVHNHDVHADEVA